MMTVHFSEPAAQQLHRGSITVRERLRKRRREFSHKIHLTRAIEFAVVKEFLEPSLGGRICDIGCGDGYWTSRLPAAKCQVIGLDLDWSSLMRAQRFYGESARFVNAEAEKLPFSSESFDRVVGICAMEHFMRDDWALQEMYRILSPDGMLMLSLDSLSLPTIPEAYKRQHCLRYHVNNLYTHGNIESKLGQAGFRLARYRYLATSRLTDFFIRLQVRLGLNVNWLFPVTLPISRIAERLSQGDQAGHILVVLAEKEV